LPIFTLPETNITILKDAYWGLQVDASNAPTNYTASGLPPGLTIDPYYGQISGTPTTLGQYTVTLGASNEAGTAQTNIWINVVIGCTISQISDDLTVDPGQNASFRVEVIPSEGVTYQWYKNSSPLQESSRFMGTTADVLIVVGVVESDEGAYTVKATLGSYSTTSDVMHLIVRNPGAPKITLQPLPIAAIPDSTVSFHVEATGDLPMSFTWYIGDILLGDGGNISGATTDTLKFTGVTLTNSGIYYVHVANAKGYEDSLPATLMVGSTMPILWIQRSLTNENYIVSWPASLPTAILQSSESLNSTTNWNPVSIPNPQELIWNTRYWLTLPPDKTQRYFRLLIPQ
jgi:hypothetical protein